MKRYENLMIGEALSRHNNQYPLACNELSSIYEMGYSQIPKNVKALIFRDTLSAFRLLPLVNTSAAVSAANNLIKSLEAVLPKQKKNLAIVEFKQAKVALKRRNKSQDEEDLDLPSLPQDVLIHIFSFLDVSSLASSSHVSRSWNLATYDVSLWRSLFDIHFKFNHKVLIHIQPCVDWRKAFKMAYIADYSSKRLRPWASGRGYCGDCDTIVWHNNLRCPNKQCRLKSEKRPLELVTTRQVVNYLLGIVSSDDESESDDETIPGLWAYPTL
ncbi:unnamed protein product [Cochlearia groenlandica]